MEKVTQEAEASKKDLQKKTSSTRKAAQGEDASEDGKQAAPSRKRPAAKKVYAGADPDNAEDDAESDEGTQQVKKKPAARKYDEVAAEFMEGLDDHDDDENNDGAGESSPKKKHKKAKKDDERKQHKKKEKKDYLLLSFFICYVQYYVQYAMFSFALLFAMQDSGSKKTKGGSGKRKDVGEGNLGRPYHVCILF